MAIKNLKLRQLVFIKQNTYYENGFFVNSRGFDYKKVNGSVMNKYFNNLDVKKSLLTISPSLAKQWHPTKNGKLEPKHVTPGSNKTVWWLCEESHEWKAPVYNRSRGIGCPYCYGLFATKETNLEAINPRLAQQWHQIKNKSLDLRDIKPMSGKKVWWLCDKGHEWEAIVANRSNGSGCPYCAGRRKRI